jgi:hypothetical protein
MDDIVGVCVLSPGRGWLGFLTYGRLWDSTDEAELVAAVRANLPVFGLYSSDEVRVCTSLQELSSCPYFFEGLLGFAWKPIPFGDAYDQWREERRAELLSGKGDGLYCVGVLQQ